MKALYANLRMSFSNADYTLSRGLFIAFQRNYRADIF
jgi:hypothetical protein|tara:strand:+ start:13401 stop:13511 length:111 start_codon:yes stop_codon:yes gene_type:complete